MKTKSHSRFFNRAAHLDADIELADILKIAIAGGALTANDGPYLFDQVNPQQHPRLAARKNNSNNRKIAVNHLKATLCASFLKDIYEDAMQYFSEILEAASRHGLDPNRLIGEHKISIETNEILLAGSWSNVVHMVSQSVFRRLEGERNTKKLIEKMNSKLALGVAGITIEAALPYFEIRHLLVHNDGKADQKFCDAFPGFGAAPNHKLILDYSVLKNARSAVFALIDEFDRQIVSSNVVSTSELQG
jgi:hypothetical protein